MGLVLVGRASMASWDKAFRAVPVSVRVIMGRLNILRGDVIFSVNRGYSHNSWKYMWWNYACEQVFFLSSLSVFFSFSLIIIAWFCLSSCMPTCCHAMPKQNPAPTEALPPQLTARRKREARELKLSDRRCGTERNLLNTNTAKNKRTIVGD